MPLPGADIDLDFTTGTYFWTGGSITAISELSCSRASNGYAKTSAGVLTSFSSNVLRITDLGLLIEDAATNLGFNSQDFSAGKWNGIGGGPSIINNNAVVAPDGTTTACTIQENFIGSDQAGAANTNSLTITSGANYAVSIWAKKQSRNCCWINFQGGAGTDWFSAVFDLVNGLVGDTAIGSTGSPAIVSSSIEAYGNGWYRCTVVGNFANTTAFYTVGACAVATGNTFSGSGKVNYTQTSGTIAVAFWGAQAELGSFSSSYILTTATSATRAADNITIISNANTDINSAHASIVAQLGNGEAGGFAANVVDSAGTNLLGFNSTDHGLTSITATLATANTTNRTVNFGVGTAWDGTGRSLALNGGTVTSDATAQTPSATQNLGSASGTTNNIFAYIRRFVIWTTRISDANLQLFTSPPGAVALMAQIVT